MLNNKTHKMKAGIAGAGIAGRLLAFHLAQAGWNVTLFDADNESGVANCSMTAAGLLNPVNELEKCAPLVLQLGLESLQQHWPRIIAQVDPTIYFRNIGSVVVAHAQDKVELQHFIGLINKNFSRADLYRFLNQKELTELEPELTKFHSGYHLPYAGQLDNQTFMVKLKKKLIELENIKWNFDCLVEDLKPGQLFCQGTKHLFDVVFDCRGLGGKGSYPQLRGVRGEIIWLHAPDVRIQHPVRLMHPRYSVYLVPRPDQIYLLGASEIEAEDMTPLSVRTALELLSGVYSIHKGFSEARIIKSAVNCRPTLPDHLPKIKYTEGYIAINGLYRHGFLVTPALIAEIMRLLNEGVSALHYKELVEKI